MTSKAEAIIIELLIEIVETQGVFSVKKKEILEDLIQEIQVYERYKPIKHDCQKLLEEASGCAICSQVLLKSPLKTKEDLKEVQKFTNWHITELTEENERLKQKNERLKQKNELLKQKKVKYVKK